MKKQFKQIISCITIMVVTLIAGFTITTLSLNLFDNMSTNQLRLLFLVDILLLLGCGAGAWYFFESKRMKAKKEKAFQKRRESRICRREQEMQGINEIINFTNFAA